MTDERPPLPPLDYLPHGTRRRGGRGAIVALPGAMLMLGGTAAFIGAYSFTETNNLVAEHQRQHDLGNGADVISDGMKPDPVSASSHRAGDHHEGRHGRVDAVLDGAAHLDGRIADLEVRSPAGV